MKVSENKWLLLEPHPPEPIVMNDEIEEVACLLDPFFEKHQLIAYLTNAIRTFEHQVRIIRQEALKVGLAKEHAHLADCDMMALVTYGGNLIPFWTLVWSECLVRGAMVNPPVAMACLFPYTKPNGDKRPAGNLVPASAHQIGKAFDIGGGKSLDAVVVVVSEAFTSQEIPNLKGYLKEPVNHCCHCDVR
jgi:hypothetical protein